MFLIFYLDSMIIPLLPELFAVIIFQAGGGSLEWGLVVLFLALVAEVAGNSTTYLAASRIGLPGRVRQAMRKWTDVLVAKRENLILTNRLAPAVPFVGFFIAACNWDYRRSMLYIVLGGLAKYGFLLGVVAVLNVAYDPSLSRNLTLVFVIAFVAVSLVVAWWRRRQQAAAGDAAPAHRGEP